MRIYHQFCKEQRSPEGLLTHIDFHCPENFNFGYDVVDAVAAQSPDKRALVWCNTELEEHIFTFGDVARNSSRIANVLRAAGVGRGDYVMVALKRHYEYWFVSIALHKLGAVLIPVTHMLTEKDFRYRMNCVKLKAVICTPLGDVHQRVAAAAADCAPEASLWTVQTALPGFSNLTEAMEAASPVFPRAETLATDPMLLYFTSGTTGYPKGVIHDFSYPLGQAVTARLWHNCDETSLHFTVAETGWAKASYGKLYGQWIVGAAVMVFDFDNFDPRQFTDVINRYGVTSFCAPPTVYRYLARKGIPDMPSLRLAASAGETLSPDISRRFTEKTGLPLYEGYGQTETTLLLCNAPGAPCVPGSLGLPAPHYRLEVRRTDGSKANAGETGEIVVLPNPDGSRPLGLFVGYLNDSERYERVWEGGVYHTGDAGWRDASGRFWFQGRADDLIKTGGFRVGPYEVENVLSEHPAVAECAVMGVPDPARGQAIKAVVVLAPGYTADREMEKTLREFANSQMAEYKWIRFIEFVEEIPKTISGKICKAALRK